MWLSGLRKIGPIQWFALNNWPSRASLAAEIVHHRCCLTEAHSKFILFLSVPTFCISTSTISPCCKKVLGLRNAPTPSGVPVMIAVPAGIVVPVTNQYRRNQLAKLRMKLPWLMWLRIFPGGKIISFWRSAVCRTAPFTLVTTLKHVPFSRSSRLMSVGPIGAKRSNALAKKNWPPQFFWSWKSRQDKSFPMV